ncbi:glutathione transferase [Aureococcus anophagefferens]|nr:glutathione transferase [Aureococcus anophagefferens]
MMRALRCYALLPALAWSLAPPQVLDAKTVAHSLWQERDLFETSVHALITRGPPGPPAFRLAYMPCRNRGEILRLMLEEAQEGAITRFLARKLDLAGRTPEEEATVDSLYCFWFATLRNNGVSHDGEHFSCAALKAVEDVEHALKAERSLVALDFSKALAGAAGFPSPRADGRGPGPLRILYELGEDDICPDWADKFGLPLLRAFADRVAARPQIAAFLASPARMPRYAREPSGASLYTRLAGRDSPDSRLEPPPVGPEPA